MSNHKRTLIVCFGLTLSTFLGLASAKYVRGGTVPPNDPLASGQSKLAKPFMFREAKLPKEFPPPGPVDKVMIKDYPTYRVARVKSGPTGLKRGTNEMFGPLFNHIKRNDIPMTAPVEIGYSGQNEVVTGFTRGAANPPEAESMAFLYGVATWGQVGADKADPRVVVEDVPPMTVLSIGVRGSYTESNMSAALEKLRLWLAKNPGRVRVTGPPRYLAYNSPFVPGFLRYGEVQLPVVRVDSSS